MKNSKKYISLLLIICIILFSTSCTKKVQKPTPKKENEPKPLPTVVKEIEKDTLTIMNQTDMIPYFQRVIVEKKIIEEEKIQIESVKKEEKKDEKTTNQETSKIVEKEPKPMTIDESILTDILKKEDTNSSKEAKPPKNIDETWKKINQTILMIHNKWNVLEPLLVAQSVSPDIISGFEETLNMLTTYGINKDYMNTITTTNHLTSFLPKFMPYFKIDIPPAIYTLKFLTRHAVLNAAMGDYVSAQKSVEKIQETSQSVKSTLIEKKAKSTVDKFDVSVINLSKSIEKKDMHLIKINGSIVMKNIMLMIEDVTKSM
ncbi:hypothetical protein [Inediibacterium massiliense]|uniref:hypothetical protein n=1 Tax=Inediibacterium massiliense TaxID=1658111 RepID=UPI0006B51CEA|nr:hypothetical protein [Inediibacterium massiliense]